MTVPSFATSCEGFSKRALHLLRQAVSDPLAGASFQAAQPSVAADVPQAAPPLSLQTSTVTLEVRARECRLSRCSGPRAHRFPAASGLITNGEATWISKQKIRFAFGTTAAPRTRRDFMPVPFPTHPSARRTSRRETFRPEKKEMC